MRGFDCGPINWRAASFNPELVSCSFAPCRGATRAPRTYMDIFEARILTRVHCSALPFDERCDSCRVRTFITEIRS